MAVPTVSATGQFSSTERLDRIHAKFEFTSRTFSLVTDIKLQVIVDRLVIVIVLVLFFFLNTLELTLEHPAMLRIMASDPAKAMAACSGNRRYRTVVMVHLLTIERRKFSTHTGTKR